ncbi:hypothetical protein DFJ58DRAFT_846534 [Suillus subalutaceus]|uniref:uncharacterized protein n=1 Tax=Suillus subalutaceus TaxID=48586 RepID=UPI001B874AF6|nr:uncharacterized protein DFJ58DRAFT_846534 [Suillus subalutaceus]KAG1837326.1 hypothetical protein DFJ58DRAFT_846534 [Suillus subalutaceus]
MCSHISQHILHTLSNVPESLKEQVGKVLPCGFCGRSGLPECAIRIKVFANGPPSLETEVYLSLRLQDRRTHLAGMCPSDARFATLVLPPEPGKSSCKIIPTFVDAVWRYNMVEHVLSQHQEYSVPGHREAGAPLPAEVWESMRLTDLEQTAAQIPKEHWQVGQEGDKENVPVSGSRTRKHPALESAASLPSKRPRYRRIVVAIGERQKVVLFVVMRFLTLFLLLGFLYVVQLVLIKVWEPKYFGRVTTNRTLITRLANVE